MSWEFTRYALLVDIYGDALRYGSLAIGELRELLDDHWYWMTEDEKERAPRVPFLTAY